jgi:malonyl CoA-acyl carrier protein transacylase
LEKKFVSNLLGVPFTSLEIEFAEAIVEQTGRSQVSSLLSNWNGTTRAKKCKVLLIELLAFQFASPVLWTATMDTVLKHSVERFIEIGPAPVHLQHQAVAVGPQLLRARFDACY